MGTSGGVGGRPIHREGRIFCGCLGVSVNSDRAPHWHARRPAGRTRYGVYPTCEPGGLALQVLGEPGANVRPSQLPQRLGLDLAHPLAADAQFLTDIPQRLRFATAEAEAQP